MFSLPFVHHTVLLWCQMFVNTEMLLLLSWFSHFFITFIILKLNFQCDSVLIYLSLSSKRYKQTRVKFYGKVEINNCAKQLTGSMIELDSFNLSISIELNSFFFHFVLYLHTPKHFGFDHILNSSSIKRSTHLRRHFVSLFLLSFNVYLDSFLFLF